MQMGRQEASTELVPFVGVDMSLAQDASDRTDIDRGLLGAIAVSVEPSSLLTNLT
jgi:hypothetical protein